MNEEELKAIWKKNENLSIENFDFTEVREKTIQLQQKIKKRMRFDVGALILGTVLAVGLTIFKPSFYWLILIMFFVWIRYWMEVSKYKKYKENFQKSGNVKEFLQMKKANSEKYQGFDKNLARFLPVITLLLAYLSQMPLELIKERWLIILLGLAFVQICMVLIVKIFYHFLDSSMLDETNELLQQLDETP